MNQHKKNWQLKNMAKNSLTGNYSEAILLTMIYGLFSIAQTASTTLLMSMGSDLQDTILNVILMKMVPDGYLLSLGVALLFQILIGFLGVGVSLFYLNIVCKAPYSLRDLFIAFKENPLKYFALTLIQVLVQFFFALPGYACNYFYLLSPSDHWITLAYICQLAGQIVAFPITLALSQCYRLLLDFPTLTVWQVLCRSNRLMKGNKLRLFGLMFSFLPLEIAAILTCGIGYLWLNPYINATYTHFYLDLVDAENQN